MALPIAIQLYTLRNEAKEDFAATLKKVKEMADIAHSFGATIEGELGHVGANANASDGNVYTEPMEAKDFAEKTGVDALAVAIGTAHGIYKVKPTLDIERLKEIASVVDVPLVLHGGSGIPDEEVKAAVKAGVRKMNIGTDVCCAFAEGTKEILDDPSRSLAIDLFMKNAIKTVKELAISKIELTGADGKAN